MKNMNMDALERAIDRDSKLGPAWRERKAKDAANKEHVPPPAILAGELVRELTAAECSMRLAQASLRKGLGFDALVHLKQGIRRAQEYIQGRACDESK